LLSGVPWSSDSSKRAWTAAFAVMVKQNDGRFVALAKVLPSKWKVRSSMQTWLERAFARAVESMKPLDSTATADEKKALDAVVKAFARPSATPKAPGGAKDEQSLLAAIHSNPTDDAPRHVLADLLQEKNDARGEFIALQLAGDEKGAAKLLKANAKQWVGALAPVLGADVEFRRGFPAVGKTKFRHQADAEAYGSLAEWATMEELEWGTPTPIPKGQAPFCRFIGPAFRHLRHADGPHLQSLLDGVLGAEEIDRVGRRGAERRGVDEAFDPRAARCGDQRAVASVVHLVRTPAPAAQQAVRAGQHPLHAATGPLQRGGVGQVSRHHLGAPCGQVRRLLGVAAQRPHRDAARAQLLDHRSAESAGGTDHKDFHGRILNLGPVQAKPPGRGPLTGRHACPKLGP